MTKDTRDEKEQINKDTEIYRKKYKKQGGKEDIQKTATEKRGGTETCNKPGN